MLLFHVPRPIQLAFQGNVFKFMSWRNIFSKFELYTEDIDYIIIVYNCVLSFNNLSLQKSNHDFI